jgi:hypothetical protein
MWSSAKGASPAPPTGRCPQRPDGSNVRTGDEGVDRAPRPSQPTKPSLPRGHRGACPARRRRHGPARRCRRSTPGGATGLHPPRPGGSYNRKWRQNRSCALNRAEETTRAGAQDDGMSLPTDQAGNAAMLAMSRSPVHRSGSPSAGLLPPTPLFATTVSNPSLDPAYQGGGSFLNYQGSILQL